MRPFLKFRAVKNTVSNWATTFGGSNKDKIHAHQQDIERKTGKAETTRRKRDLVTFLSLSYTDFLLGRIFFPLLMFGILNLGK
jgi:hypothetical protein